MAPFANPQNLLIAAMALGVVLASGLLMFLWPGRGGVLRLADGAAALTALTVLAIPALMFAGFDARDSLIDQWTNGQTGRFWGLIIAANGAAVLSLAMSGVCVWAWARPPVRVGQTLRTVHLTAVALAGLGMTYIFSVFNLLGVHIPG